MSEAKKLSDKEIQLMILEETAVFLKENKATIVKRVQKKLREQTK